MADVTVKRAAKLFGSDVLTVSVTVKAPASSHRMLQDMKL